MGLTNNPKTFLIILFLFASTFRLWMFVINLKTNSSLESVLCRNKYHISVFKASPTFLQQLKIKCSEIPQPLKNITENLEKCFYLQFFRSSPNLHQFVSKFKRNRDTRTSIFNFLIF